MKKITMHRLTASSSSRRRRAASGPIAAFVAALVALAAPATPAAEEAVTQAPAMAETRPSDVAGDTMDDPAIWVDPIDPARSVVIGADHRDYSLSVYDLSGARLQKLSLSHANNVDLRPGFPLAGKTVPIVGLAGSGSVSFYSLDPETRKLANVTKGGATIDRDALEKPGEGPFYAHGMCLYHSPASGDFYAFVVDRFGHVKQLRLTDDGNGKVAVEEVRQIDIAPRPAVGNPDQTEACVVDDAGRSLFIAEQDWYIWRYGAEPTDPTGTDDRAMVDKEVGEGGHFVREAEGLAFVSTPAGESYLIASTQKADAYNVYRGSAPYAYIRQVQVVASGGVDGCENTDGIDAVAADAGPAFPRGVFVCQDNANADGNMNFKMARLEDVVPLGEARPVPTTTTTTTPPTAPGGASGPPPARDTGSAGGGPSAPPRSGYWMLGSAGRVYPFGDARSYGDAPLSGPARAVDLEPTPSGTGYWVVDDRGRVFARGDAAFHGNPSPSSLHAGETVTSLSATPTGAGYWIFTSRGRAFAFGDAIHLGDMAATRLNAPVLDSIVTPSGRGYYMVGADGGIFSFGDARFFGSMGGIPLNEPVESLVPDPDGAGYWLVAADGGVFAFEADFRGSMGATPLNRPVTGMVPFGNGYLMVGEDGGIFNFSDRPFLGSLGADPPADPITAVATLR